MTILWVLFILYILISTVVIFTVLAMRQIKKNNRYIPVSVTEDDFKE